MPNIRPETNYSACDYRSDELAKEMLANIIGEKSFDIDDIEWDDTKITVPEDLMSKWQTDVDPVTIDELTERKVKGSGVFDAMMHAIRVHLKEEYDNNRITGAEYATTYTRLTEAALGNAVQFCLQKNQAYFQGILAQAQAIIAGIQAQIAALTAKVQLAKVKAEALGVAAEYALTTMKLSTEDAQHALVCKQQAVTDAEIGLRTAQAEGEQATTLLKQYQAELANPRPASSLVDANGNPTNIEYQLKKKQMEDQTAQTAIRELQLQANQPTTPIDENGNEITNGNIDFLIKEKQLEQADAQVDVSNEQKNLYQTQATAYQHKWELDVASLYANQYTAMKSVDEGLALPKAFSGASINEVLQLTKAKVNLGADNTNTTTTAWLKNGVLSTPSDVEANEPEAESSNP